MIYSNDVQNVLKQIEDLTPWDKEEVIKHLIYENMSIEDIQGICPNLVNIDKPSTWVDDVDVDRILDALPEYDIECYVRNDDYLLGQVISYTPVYEVVDKVDDNDRLLDEIYISDPKTVQKWVTGTYLSKLSENNDSIKQHINEIKRLVEDIIQ